ncbi:DUF2188 domain-containing protein [Candidatus Peregrinibacteria bacterium]|nr:DUF2188 domain-containing protein [Candidatus Peregrinibacteria bacterium]
MKKLPKFTLSLNKKSDRWDLKNDKTNKVLKSVENKADIMKGGVIKKIVGKEGASVKVKKMDGKFQEERTYPKSADPKKSKG